MRHAQPVLITKYITSVGNDSKERILYTVPKNCILLLQHAKFGITSGSCEDLELIVGTKGHEFSLFLDATLIAGTPVFYERNSIFLDEMNVISARFRSLSSAETLFVEVIGALWRKK